MSKRLLLTFAAGFTVVLVVAGVTYGLLRTTADDTREAQGDISDELTPRDAETETPHEEAADQLVLSPTPTPTPTPSPSPTSPSEEVLSRPVIRLSHEGQEYTGLQGSSCWPVPSSSNDIPERLCVDWPFPQVSEFSETISIISGDNLYPVVRAHEPPSLTTASVYYPLSGYDELVPQMVESIPFTDSFRLELPPGIYIVSVLADWPVGDVSYAFKVQVDPLGAPP